MGWSEPAGLIPLDIVGRLLENGSNSQARVHNFQRHREQKVGARAHGWRSIRMAGGHDQFGQGITLVLR